MDRVQLDAMNKRVIEEFRANAGKVGPPFEGAPVVLLHNKGAKSGKDRVSPLVYTRDGERYVIIASYAGAPKHPAWYHNLQAHPRTKIDIGTETIEVVASEVTGEERDRLYNAQAEMMPVFHEYQAKTDRKIPVVVLTPV